MARSRFSALSRLLLSQRLPLRHPVSDAGLSEDVGGAVGGIAQLASEPLHHFANQPGFAGPLRTPDLLQQLVVSRTARPATRCPA